MTTERALAVWLYGSHARGDADELSDTDLAVITDSARSATPVRGSSTTDPSISRYTWDEVTGMATYGSLFLRHLELEGRRLYESAAARGRLQTILRQLGPYQHATRDVAAFRTVVRDVRESLNSGDASLLFELSTLATLFRHASILGCYLASRPCFARSEPVARLSLLWNLPSEWATDFSSFYRYRMYAEGRLDRVSRPHVDLAYLWCDRSDALIEELSRRS